jgi:HEPN domain-containing protein
MEVNVAELISEADDLMEVAEEKVERQFYSAYPLMQQAIENLFKAFLMAGGQKLKGISGLGAKLASNVGVLFEHCRGLAPEFETIEEIVGYFTHEAPSAPDPETISDAANEIWDFVIDLLSGEDEADQGEE